MAMLVVKTAKILGSESVTLIMIIIIMMIIVEW